MCEISCERFRQLYPDFSRYMRVKERERIWDEMPADDDEQYDAWFAWTDHYHGCRDCADWSMARAVDERGLSISDFPCVHIAYYSTGGWEQHPERLACPNLVVEHDVVRHEYAITPRGGDGSYLAIHYCPWCGKQLPAPERGVFGTYEGFGDGQLLPIALELKPFDSDEARNSFLDRFCDAIDAAGLDFGGGGTGADWSGFAGPAGRSLTISKEQAQQVRSWAEAQAEIRRSKVGPIMRDSEVCVLMDANPNFPVPQDWTANPPVQSDAASRSDGRDDG